jgi:RNA polymerase sigma-70 factor (ECF subfamily)
VGQTLDLVQEAWLRLEQKGGVRDRAQLFLTIRRLYIDQYRHARVIRFESLENVTELAGSGCSIAGVLAAADLEKPLARLREEEREVLFLSVVEGYTAQEVADLTQRPRNTVLSLIHRARAKLRRELDRGAVPATVQLGANHE